MPDYDSRWEEGLDDIHPPVNSPLDHPETARFIVTLNEPYWETPITQEVRKVVETITHRREERPNGHVVHHVNHLVDLTHTDGTHEVFNRNAFHTFEVKALPS